MSEIEYHNVHVNNNFKILAIAGYFMVIPVVLAIDFFIVQCTHSCRAYQFISEKIPQRFFFSGPLVLFTLFFFPIGIHCLLEFRFYKLYNDFQIYSLATCFGIMLILSLFWFSLWATVLTHYKHKQHPLVLKRFEYIFASLIPEANSFALNAAVPLYVTRRMASMFIVGLLCRYTVGPLIILAFF